MNSLLGNTKIFTWKISKHYKNSKCAKSNILKIKMPFHFPDILEMSS